MVIQPLSTRLIKPKKKIVSLSHRRSTPVSLKTRNPFTLSISHKRMRSERLAACLRAHTLLVARDERQILLGNRTKKSMVMRDTWK